MPRKEWGYGFFPGGDPRRFTPDEESNTPEEIAAHKAACEAWEAGNTEALPGSCVHFPGGVVTLSGFGLGSYWYEEDDGPWYPRVLRFPFVTPRVPRRMKKRLQSSGWRLDDYGWRHESWTVREPEWTCGDGL